MHYVKVVLLFLIVSLPLLSEVNLNERILPDANRDADITDTSSNLGYFKYYEQLPKTIYLPIIEEFDMSAAAGKKYLFIGYGVDPLMDVNISGCKIVEINGKEQKICLPWWQIDRVYECNASSAYSSNDLLKEIRNKTHPPKLVNICEEYEGDIVRSGGLVTCTAYYDKHKNASCEKNPFLAYCLVNNCSDAIRKNCKFKEYIVGAKENEEYPVLSQIPTTNVDYVNIDPTDSNMRERYIQVGTLVYECPSYVDTSGRECTKERSVVMFPYMCKPDDPETKEYDAEWVYCDTNNFAKASDGSYVFFGKCSDGKEVVCSSTVCTNEIVCAEPVYDEINETKTVTCDNLNRLHKPCSEVYDLRANSSSLYAITYINGTPVIEKDNKCYISVQTGYVLDNPFEQDPNCLRVSTPAEETSKPAMIYMQSKGQIDDDIFVIIHKANGGFKKIYCNQQHNESGKSLKWSASFEGYNVPGYKHVVAKLYDTGGNLINEIEIYLNAVEDLPVHPDSIDLASDDRKSVKVGMPFEIVLGTTKDITKVVIYPDADHAGTELVASSESIASGNNIVRKEYSGSVLECLDNNGIFEFPAPGESGYFEIYPDEVVSVQRATENENGGCTPFNCGRTHFTSSNVIIAGYEVAPKAYPAEGDYNYYVVKRDGCYGKGCLKIWENTLFSVSLLFPYAGRYKLDFISGSGEVLATVNLDYEDFKKIAQSPTGRVQLRLGATAIQKDANGYYNTKLLNAERFGLEPNEPDFDETKINENQALVSACLDDMAEIGCGVYGGRGLQQETKELLITKRYHKTSIMPAISVPAPDDNYVREHYINKIVITNYAASSITEVKLVYPLPFMNQIYISKLKLYENLRYECFKDEYEKCVE